MGLPKTRGCPYHCNKGNNSRCTFKEIIHLIKAVNYINTVALLYDLGTNQQASKKSVVPGLTDAGGLRPLLNMPQQQQDLTNPQGPPQAQAPNLDANQAVNPMQMPFGDQLQAPPQTSPQAAVVPQPFAPVNLTDSNSLGQNPQQALDQVQGGVPQAPEQAFAPQAAAPSDMQAPGSENVAAAFPMSKSNFYLFDTRNNRLFLLEGWPGKLKMNFPKPQISMCFFIASTL